MDAREGEKRLASIQDALAEWAHEYERIAEQYTLFHPTRIMSAGKGMLVAAKAVVDFIPVIPTLFKAEEQ